MAAIDCVIHDGMSRPRSDGCEHGRYPGVLTCVVGTLLAAAGCDHVFGLADRLPIDAALIDGPPVASCASPGQRIELPLLADTYLDLTAKHGTDPVLKVSSSPQTVLLRLGLGDLAPTISTVQVDLAFVQIAGACGPGGGTCMSCVSAPGMITVYWMQPDWDEGVVDRQLRKAGVPWEAQGATGSTDRSDPIAVFTQATFDLTASLPFDAGSLRSGWSSDLLGIQLVGAPGPSAGTYASKEGAENACDPSRPAPRVTVTCK